MATKKYLIEHSDYDGYRQHFSAVCDWKTVLKWAKEGSIQNGDVVYKIIKCKQPKIPKDRFA